MDENEHKYDIGVIHGRLQILHTHSSKKIYIGF